MIDYQPTIQDEGRCPICYTVMKSSKTVYWKDTNLVGWWLSGFPYLIYECKYHGAYIWKGEKTGHILANFSDLKRYARNKERINALDRLYEYCVQFKIITIICPYCEENWEQHQSFGRKNKAGKLIEYRCPNGHLIPM